MVSTGTFGQTKKQKEMSTARSPRNFNMPNNQPEAQDYQQPAQDFRQQQSAWEPIADPHTESGAARPRDTRAQPGAARNPELNAAVQQNIKNLGTFGLQVQASVNRFLEQGQGLMGSTGGTGAVWDEQQGGWTLGDTMRADVQGLAEGKAQEQESIDELLSEWYDVTGDRSAVSFREGLEREATRLSEKYPDIAKKQNYLLSLADRLQMLEDEGLGNSAEARALRQSIILEDDQGLVQLIYDAHKEYQRNIYGDSGRGLTWSGDGFTDFSAHDLVSLSSEELQKEIQNVAVGALGIFSGDYVVNLKQQLDEMREEYLKSGQEEVRRNQEFKRLAEEYLENWGQTMGGEATSIQEAFQETLGDLEDQIIALNNVKPGVISLPDGSTYNMGRNAERGEVARAYLATLGGGDFNEGLLKMLNDPNSGLQTNQRALFRQYLGTDQGGVGSEGGQLHGWMQQLARGQPLSFEGRQLQLTADDKAQVIRAAYANDEEAINNILKNSMKRINVDLDNLLEQSRMSPNLGAALEVWEDSVANSVKNFIYSKTEDTVKEALGLDDEAWSNLSAEEKQVAMADAASRTGGYGAFENMLKGAAEKINRDLSNQIQEKRAAIDQTKANAEEVLKQAKEARNSINTEYQKAMEAAKSSMGSMLDRGYDRDLAKKYIDMFRAEDQKNPYASSYGNLIDAVNQGQLPRDTWEVLGQVGAVLSQVRALQGHPEGRFIAQEMVKEINALNAQGVRLGAGDIVSGINPFYVAKAGRSLANRIQQIWDRGVVQFEADLTNKISDGIKGAGKLREEMLKVISQDEKNAKALLKETQRNELILAETLVNYKQGVFTPADIINFAMEQARIIEQGGTAALDKMLGAYRGFEGVSTSDQSAYRDLGGFEGRGTTAEVVELKNQIHRKDLMSGAAGLRPEDVGKLAQEVAPVRDPEILQDWVADRRKMDVRNTPDGGLEYKGKPVGVASDGGVANELLKDPQGWMQSGAAQSSKVTMPGGGTVNGYVYLGQDGNAHFVPDPKSLTQKLIPNLANPVITTVANWPDWAKELVGKVPGGKEAVQEAEFRYNYSIETRKLLNHLGTNTKDVDIFSMSIPDQKALVESKRKVVQDGIANMARMEGHTVRPDAFDGLSSEGLAQMFKEYKQRYDARTWERIEKEAAENRARSDGGPMDPIREEIQRTKPQYSTPDKTVLPRGGGSVAQ